MVAGVAVDGGGVRRMARMIFVAVPPLSPGCSSLQRIWGKIGIRNEFCLERLTFHKTQKAVECEKRCQGE